jgi:hypothetical protein
MSFTNQTDRVAQDPNGPRNLSDYFAANLNPVWPSMWQGGSMLPALNYNDAKAQEERQRQAFGQYITGRGFDDPTLGFLRTMPVEAQQAFMLNELTRDRAMNAPSYYNQPATNPAPAPTPRTPANAVAGDTMAALGFAAPMTDQLQTYANSIAGIESAGSGDYRAVGPRTSSGDRAYGRYQVMGNNVGPWTEKHYGTRLTPQEFLANDAAQDAVFAGEFGSYVDKYGNPQDAASMWFSGRPMAGNNRNDGYTSVPEYIQKFNAGLEGLNVNGTRSGGAPTVTWAQLQQAARDPDISQREYDLLESSYFAQNPSASIDPIEAINYELKVLELEEARRAAGGGSSDLPFPNANSENERAANERVRRGQTTAAAELSMAGMVKVKVTDENGEREVLFFPEDIQAKLDERSVVKQGEDYVATSAEGAAGGMTAKQASELSGVPQTTIAEEAKADVPTVGQGLDLTDPYQRETTATKNQKTKITNAKKALDAGLQKYRELVQEGGGAYVAGTEKDALDAVVTDMMLQAKELYNLGVLNGPDYALMQQMIYDPTLGAPEQGLLATIGQGAGMLLGEAGIMESPTQRALSSADNFGQIMDNNYNAWLGSEDGGPAEGDVKIPEGGSGEVLSFATRATEADIKGLSDEDIQKIAENPDAVSNLSTEALIALMKRLD